MEPDRPNIQIDDLVRPMTDDEYAAWQIRQNTIRSEMIAAGDISIAQEGNTPEPWPDTGA